jgi:hypothetical protein
LGLRGDLVGQLELDNASLQANHRRLSSVASAQFGEDVLNSPLYGFFGDRELIGNLLIGISCGAGSLALLL